LKNVSQNKYKHKHKLNLGYRSKDRFSRVHVTISIHVRLVLGFIVHTKNHFRCMVQIFKIFFLRRIKIRAKIIPIFRNEVSVSISIELSYF
jgi:hypothetical protein